MSKRKYGPTGQFLDREEEAMQDLAGDLYLDACERKNSEQLKEATALLAFNPNTASLVQNGKLIEPKPAQLKEHDPEKDPRLTQFQIKNKGSENKL